MSVLKGFGVHHKRYVPGRLRGIATVAAGMWLLLAAVSPAAMGANQPVTVMARFPDLAEQCAPKVGEGTLSSLVLAESSGNPYLIHVNTRSVSLTRQPTTRNEAIAAANALLRLGVSFDSGLGQVNSGNLGALGLSIEALFDPCSNLHASAQVLIGCYDRALSHGLGVGQPALWAALSCYNTNSLQAGFSNGYVKGVLANAGHEVPNLSPVTSGSKHPLEIEIAPHAAVATEHAASPAPAAAQGNTKAPAAVVTDGNDEGHDEPDIFSQPEEKENDETGDDGAKAQAAVAKNQAPGDHGAGSQ